MSDIPESEFRGADAALRSAQGALVPPALGPDMDDLARARVGSPVLVRTTAGEPSYWLVPLGLDDRTVGFVRVTASGTVAAVGRYGGSSALDLDPGAVIALAADRLAGADIVSEPTLVHDGPPGREAWMVVTSIHGGPARCLFVTPAGLYERGMDDDRSPAVE